MKPTSVSRRGRQRGVGLIEVLIAVLVMGIGLLGLAALQATALRRSQSGLERSQAVLQSNSILDAMRANRDAALAGQYNIQASTDCAIPEGFAAATTLAGQDTRKWRSALVNMLGPGACGSVNVNKTTQVAEITVSWNDQRAGGQDGEKIQSRTIL